MMQEGAEKILGDEAPATEVSGGKPIDDGPRASSPPRENALDLPEDLFDEPSAWDEPSEADDFPWPVDPEARAHWKAAAARRAAIKIVAYSVLAELAFALVVLVMCAPEAAREIAYWSTMGQAGDASVTARVVRANHRAERREPGPEPRTP